MRTLDQYYEALKSAGWDRRAAAENLGVSERAVRRKAQEMKLNGYAVPLSPRDPARPAETRQTKPAEFEVQHPPAPDMPIEDLIAHRKRSYEQRKAHEEAAKLIPVKIKLDGPIGILHFGDPHIDDDGTDIAALERHTELVAKTEGLFGGNVGDTTNNWVGRLARLYADQATTASQAWQLADWFISRIPWLYIIAGNHDLWSGAGDPLKWIARQQNALYQSTECRLELRFPNSRTVRVNCRHDFAGNSQYNPAHGPMKAALFGTRDHLFTAGHKHESAYGVLKDSDSGITMHAIKVGSYKVYDRFAREKGFRDQQLSPCCLTVIDPTLPNTHPDLVKIWWNPEEGAEYLTWLRKRAKRKAA